MSSLPEVSRPVFVTGGSGFVGRAVLELCLDRGRCVITTTRARSIEAFISALCAPYVLESHARTKR
jgi:NADPH:quinone reductase-like Zn-dependent oxidoreductase